MNKKKTIWIVYPYGDIIGEKFLEARHIRFGRILARNGYKVIFWTANFSHTFKKMRCNGWKKINVCQNFDLVLVPSCKYNKNISIGRVLFEFKYANSLNVQFKHMKEPDLIITAGTGLLTSFYPVWPYIKNRKIKTIYDIMDIHLFNSYMEEKHRLFVPFAKILTKFLENREKGFYSKVDAICGLGKNQVEIAKRRTGREVPTCLVYNGINIDEFRHNMSKRCSITIPKKEEGWIWCVFAGYLGPSYDIETLISCARKIKKQNDKIKIIVAGAGTQADSVVEEAKINDRIVYLGSLNPQDLPPLYAKCDIGLCTYAAYSTVDMPDKLYDYVAAGLGVVNSLQGEIKEYIETYDFGKQYIAGDAEDLYKNIKLTSANLEFYKENAYKIGEKFDLGKLMEPMCLLIDNMFND